MYLFPKLSFRGFVDVFPSDLAFANTGDSSIFLRIIYDTNTMMIETQNGTLHPHSSKASLDKALFVKRITINEINKPTVAVV